MSFVDLFSFRELSAASVASWRTVGRIVVTLGTVVGTDADGSRFEYTYSEWEDREFSMDREHGDSGGNDSCKVGATELD